MKQIIFEPTTLETSTVIQSTRLLELDESIFVHVPNGYQAILVMEEKILIRIDQTAKKNLFKLCGKEYRGKMCQILFVCNKMLPDMLWGFGNIQVNNERLKEAYRIGANGKYNIEITNQSLMLRSIGFDKNITIEMIREHTVPILKNIGTALLGQYFAKSDISIFEISAHIAEFRDQLLNALKVEKAFAEIGIRLKDLTVDGIHVNQEDLDMIRNRINGIESLSMFTDEAIDVDSAPENSDNGSLPQSDRNQPDNQNNGDVTAEFLIGSAKNPDDYIPAAAMIYSNVEKNLIETFHLPYENHTFVIEYDKYLQLAEKVKVNGFYLLKKRDPGSGELKPFPPSIVTKDSSGEAVLVEMFPIVRFLQIGMPPEIARNAAEKWGILNRIRHTSENNREYLKRYFDENEVNEGEYLMDTLEFFKAKNLYTKE